MNLNIFKFAVEILYRIVIAFKVAGIVPIGVVKG